MSRKAVKMSQTEFEDLLISWSRKQYTFEQAGHGSLKGEADFEATLTRNNLIERRLYNVFGWSNNNNLPVIKDLSKVEFDFENFGCEPGTLRLDGADPCGFWMTPSGIPTMGCYAGGDWEDPVFFVLYPESKTQIRAYMPKAGNTWNLKTRAAWGNGEDEDYDDDNPRKVDVDAFRADVAARLQAK